jgi:hypothetical protein
MNSNDKKMATALLQKEANAPAEHMEVLLALLALYVPD